MQEKKVFTGEIHLQVREYARNGSAVIFLHYGGGNMQMWRDVAPFFKDKFHVVLLDLRGHGGSDKPQNGYHIDQLARDVVGVLDKLGISAAHLVGSSLGAEVGLSLAANHPGRVLSLVCEGALFNEGGPYGLFTGSQAEFEQYAGQKMHDLRMRPEKAYASVDEMVAESRSFFEPRGWWSDVFEDVVRHDTIQREDGKFVRTWDRIVAAYMQDALHYNFGDYYARVACPLLMLPDTYPGQDEREVRIMNDLFALLEDGQIVYVPEWVHPFGWMITPESISREILAFFAAHPG